VRAKAAAGGIAVLLLSCGGAYLTAPPGSTLILVANPKNISSNGGVSELSAIVTEPAGTDVPDGTLVLWSTTLGHVDRETRTVRGIARNRLISDSRSGTAHVVAQSGADALPPTTTPATTTPGSTTPGSTTPGTTTPGSTTTLQGPGTGGLSMAGTSALLGVADNSAAVDITIGNALVATVRLRADPPRITISNSTHVIATVLDAFGNPVANVPVFFEVITNKDFDFFDSGGAAVFTNNNGEAEDVLRTRRINPGTITVQASAAAGGGFKDSPRFDIPFL
jgi:hypothetical protein